MAARQNQRIELKVVTPKGIAIYPKLNKPDTKFDKDGVYETKLKFEPDATDGVLGKKSSSWADIIAKVQEQQEEFLAAKKKELQAGDGKAKAKARVIETIEWGCEPDLNDDGEETGKVVVKAKMKASGTNKENKRWTRKPVLFDAKGKKLPEDSPDIWGGSTLKVAGTVVPYYNAKDNVVGSTMYLEAVQVINLVTGSGGSNAGDYGFGETEGYTTEGEDDSSPFADDEESDGGENGDF